VATESLTLKARFILSFDCEGKWGMADDPAMASNNPINGDSLTKAYTQIFKILERHKIPATFALVGLFAGGYEQYVDSRGELLDSEPHRNWLEVPERSFAAGHHDGWFYPELVNQIKARGNHEIASHSFTHLPLHNGGVAEKSFLTELKFVNQWKAQNSVELSTYIYPRNQIKFEEQMSNFDFLGYRQCDIQNSAYANRFQILQDECNIGRKSDKHSVSTRPIAIPPGTFLNWRHGPRRIIPKWVTLKRWSNVLDHAVFSGGVAHLWLHPHNLITARGQVELFEDAISRVAKAQNSGLIKSVTQADYCKEIAQQASFGDHQ
jgi:hypothetical protein